MLPERNTEIKEVVVNTFLQGINLNKCSGPGGIDDRTLTFCADQLSGVLGHFYQASICRYFISCLCNISTIIPVLKPGCTDIACDENSAKDCEVIHSLCSSADA